MALILFCSVLRGLRSYEDLDQEIRTVAYLRLDAIAFGMIAIFLNWKSSLAKAAILAGTLGLFLLSELIVLSGMVEKGDSLLASPIFARDILFLSAPLTGCLVLSLIKHVKSPKSHVRTIITFLSKISYPLYLFHFIIAWTLQITDLDHNIEFVLFWTFSILVSYLIHKGIEPPIMTVRRQLAY